MKKIIILPILALMLLFSDFNAYAQELQYTVIDGRTTVTGFTGEPESLEIPPEIEGAPVVEIRDNAFYKCSSLKRIALPESLEKMGHHCFFGCTSLEQISLPDGVSEIGMGCFNGCSSLREVILPENLTILPDSCFRDCTSLKAVMLPQNVTEIRQFCFAGCADLSDVSLSGRLSAIGDLAFFGCSSVKEIYIPDSVETVGTQALGYSTDGQISGFSITGTYGSAVEKYAEENGISFSGQPAAADVFAPRDSENAPVELPEIFIFAGLFFLIMAMISAFRNSRR